MKYEIIWSKDAGEELFEIISYIKYNTGKNTADQIYSKITKEIKRVSESTAKIRVAPLLKEIGINHIYQHNIDPWIIFYKTEKNKMLIISIIDGRRNLEEILYKKMLDGKIT